MAKIRVLFVCTHNSARSQMAEGMLRHWGGDLYDAESAGTEPAGIRPETIQVMDEIGIDIRAQRSKAIGDLVGESFDHFITVCDEAQANCPVLPGVSDVAHWSTEDPSAADGSPAERLDVFRRVRDQLAERVRTFMHVTAGQVDAPRREASTLT